MLPEFLNYNLLFIYAFSFQCSFFFSFEVLHFILVETETVIYILPLFLFGMYIQMGEDKKFLRKNNHYRKSLEQMRKYTIRTVFHES